MRLLLSLLLLVLIIFIHGERDMKSKLFIVISAHHQSYHDAFVKMQQVKTGSKIECLSLVESIRHGSYETGGLASLYNSQSHQCQIGKVPFQLVRVVQDLVRRHGFDHFVQHPSPENLLMWINGLTDFTKIALIGYDSDIQVVDLSSTTSNCVMWPKLSTERSALLWFHDQLVSCAGYAPGFNLGSALCYGLSMDQSSWQIFSQNLGQGTIYPFLVQRDFNDFILVGGALDPYEQPQLEKMTIVNNGTVNPPIEDIIIPPSVKEINHGSCYVQLDSNTLFVAGGLVSGSNAPPPPPPPLADFAGLWEIENGQWTELPKLQEERKFAACGIFRKNKQHLEVVVAGGDTLQGKSKLIEIYDPVSKTKRMGSSPLNFIPVTIPAQFSDHFIVAGDTEMQPKYSLFKFNPSTEEFVRLPHTITETDMKQAIPVPDAITNCTDLN